MTRQHRGTLMLGLMQDWPLLCHRIIDHAALNHPARRVVSRSVEGPIHTTNYHAIRARALRVAKRLTKEYNIDLPLDPHLLPSIFTYCQFYILHFNRTDTWCSLLSPKELLLLRYHWDIHGYHTYLYGHPLNQRLGCKYYTQLVNGVEDYLNGKSFMYF